MSEEPTDIPLMEFVSTELITATVTHDTNGLWATYEVVNMGTAPTDREDLVMAAVIYQGTQLHSAEHRFDDPVLAPNGGSHKGSIHIHPEHLPIDGDWELYIAIPNKGIGEGFRCDARYPFKVAIHAAAEGQ